MTHAQNRARFLVWFYWGAELRVFLFSGLLEELAKTADVVVLSRVVDGDIARALTGKCEIRPLPPLRVPRWLRTLNSFANQVHGVWLQRSYSGLAIRDRANERSTPFGRREKIRSALTDQMASRRASVILTLLQRKAIARLAKTQRALLPSVGASQSAALLTGDYLSVEGQMFGSLARSRGFHVFFYQLNLRDISKGSRIVVSPSCFLLWTEQMRGLLYRNNPWLSRDPSCLIGSTQFDSHFRDDWLLSREEFCRRLGLDPLKALICYSAVNERAYSGEAETVRMLLRGMSIQSLEGRVQLIVRLNPTASDPGYAALAAEHPGMVVLSAPVYDTRFTREGGPTWHSNTLDDSMLLANIVHHCALNVCLPSTMILDFGVRLKPTICIGFDPDGHVGPANAADYLRQELFASALHAGVCMVAREPGEFCSLLEQLLGEGMRNGTRCQQWIREQRGSMEGMVSPRVAQTLITCLNPPGGSRGAALRGCPAGGSK